MLPWQHTKTNHVIYAKEAQYLVLMRLIDALTQK